jgi:hypothetical protein
MSEKEELRKELAALREEISSLRETLSARQPCCHHVYWNFPWQPATYPIYFTSGNTGTTGTLSIAS